MLRRILVDLFPALAGARFTHAWGGNLGIPRDWYPSLGYDRHSGRAYAGGYVETESRPRTWLAARWPT